MSQLLDVDGLLDEALSPSQIARAVGSPAKKPMVLVASPIAACRSIIRTTLESLGYRVIIAHDAYSAADQCRSRPGIGLALIDENLSQSDGIQFTKQLRLVNATIRVVVLTTKRSLWRRWKARRAGVNQLAARIPTPEEVVGIVQMHLPI